MEGLTSSSTVGIHSVRKTSLTRIIISPLKLTVNSQDKKYSMRQELGENPIQITRFSRLVKLPFKTKGEVLIGNYSGLSVKDRSKF